MRGTMEECVQARCVLNATDTDTLPIIARIRKANLLVEESPALLVHLPVEGEVLIMREMR